MNNVGDPLMDTMDTSRRRGGRPPGTAERAADVAASGPSGGLGNGGLGLTWEWDKSWKNLGFLT